MKRQLIQFTNITDVKNVALIDVFLKDQSN